MEKIPQGPYPEGPSLGRVNSPLEPLDPEGRKPGSAEEPYDTDRLLYDYYAQISRLFAPFASPFDGPDSIFVTFPRDTRGEGPWPVETIEHLQAGLDRLKCFPRFVDFAIDHTSGCLETTPGARIVYEGALTLLEDIVPSVDPSGEDESPLRGIIDQFMPSILKEEGADQALRSAYEDVIVQKVIPGYRELINFLRDKAIPKAREDNKAGLHHAGSKGQLAYAGRVEGHTRPDMVGFDSLENLVQESLGTAKRDLDLLQRDVSTEHGIKFSGTREFIQYMYSRRQDESLRNELGFKDVAELRSYLNGLHNKAEEAYSRIGLDFAVPPCDIRIITGELAKTGIAEYRPATKGTNAAFYLPVSDISSLTKPEVLNLFVHEILGHHYHYSKMLEHHGEIPRLEIWPLTEGIAMYADVIARDVLGMYETFDERFASCMMWYNMAITCHNDLTIHGYGLSIDEARKVRRRSGVDPLDDNHTTETNAIRRLIGWPAQQFAFLAGAYIFIAGANRLSGDISDLRTWLEFVCTLPVEPLHMTQKRIDEWFTEKAQTVHHSH